MYIKDFKCKDCGKEKEYGSTQYEIRFGLCHACYKKMINNYKNRCDVHNIRYDEYCTHCALQCKKCHSKFDKQLEECPRCHLKVDKSRWYY